ncbi:unnamed protein product [Gordionus sp. m RMFG-2023]|uniref:uncharacterized protein LOC135923640 n=1 Tax=Gordionus sp. m RMFG-2023 TaxID=3053472 RepID=UPI0030E47DF8
MEPNSWDYQYWAEKSKGRIVRALAKQFFIQDLNKKLELETPNYLEENVLLKRLLEIETSQKHLEKLLNTQMKKLNVIERTLHRIEDGIQNVDRKYTVKPLEYIDKIQITGPMHTTSIPPSFKPQQNQKVKANDINNGPCWDDVMLEMIAKRSQLKKIKVGET